MLIDSSPRNCAAVLLLGLALAGCGSTPVDPPDDPPVATTVSITPASLDFSSLGETRQLTAVVLDQNGSTLADASVVWESSDPTVVSVTPEGLASAVTNGTATVRASAGAASIGIGTTVAQEVAALDVSADTIFLLGLADSELLTVTALDAGGSEVAGAALTRTSADVGVATVDSDGLVVAVSSGSTTITIEATAGGGSATEEVVVVVELLTLEISTTDLPNPAQMRTYDGQLAASGGDGVYEWDVVSGSVPMGLSLAPTGILSGVATGLGESTFTARVRSGDGQEATVDFTLRTANILGRWVDASGASISEGAVGATVWLQLCSTDPDIVAFQGVVGGFGPQGALIGGSPLDAAATGTHVDCTGSDDGLEVGLTLSGTSDPVTALVVSNGIVPGTSAAGILTLEFELSQTGMLSARLDESSIVAARFDGSDFLAIVDVPVLDVR